ncbi:MAG: hypothetical protein JOZ29_02885 [Deltaproteobacteria bacterium]|nr:hypothetical protein [Deltaproteobacteria bacterium]
MKICISRSSLLTAIVIAVLIAATPFALAEFYRTGQIYLFSHRFVDDMIARLHGRGRLRFIFQPTVAIVLGARDGVKDARTGHPPFLWGLVFHPADRPGLLRSAVTSVRDLVAVAILLDVASQFLILRRVNPFAALLLGPVLIGLPYASSRALTNRIVRHRPRRVAPAESTGAQT